MLIAFNKPFNVLCQFTDRSDPPRRTLAGVGLPPRVYAAGRLDYDSEGLLLLTDDGALANRLTDPRHKQPKTGIPMVQPRQAVEQRGLAHARVANDGDELSALHLQIHAFEHRLPAVALGKAAHLQQGRGLGAHALPPHTRARTACTSCAVASGASQAIEWRWGMLRSQVIWRLANWRVAAMPRSGRLLIG